VVLTVAANVNYVIAPAAPKATVTIADNPPA
jgi:hypothetical protein